MICTEYLLISLFLIFFKILIEKEIRSTTQNDGNGSLFFLITEIFKKRKKQKKKLKKQMVLPY